ncbi:MAG: methyl-accepting chemotaxis protein, partial [Oscillospiraceae bacterium]
GLALIYQVDTQYSAALVSNGFVLGDIGNYNSHLAHGGAKVRDIIMLTDPAQIKASQEDMQDSSKLALESLEKAKVNCKTPEELAIIARIDAAEPKYQAGRDKAVALGLQNKNDEALNVFLTEANPYLAECVASGQELMDLNIKMGNEISATLTRNSYMSMAIMAIVMISAFIISIVFAIFVSRGIAKPVKACSDRLVLLSEGDLHTPVPDATSRDEVGVMTGSLKFTTDFLNSVIGEIGHNLGEMAHGNLDVDTKLDYKGDFDALKQSMGTIVSSFNDTLGQINIASDQVSSGSDQVSSGAQALSQGATEQASAVEELAATITEISSQIKANAENAAGASDQANQAGMEVTQSNKKMQELIVAMQEISTSSQEIGKVIKTIDDIAFQTNILALNAAVEAA